MVLTTSVSECKLKRAFDIVFSTFFLLVTSPLLTLLALIIRCTSKGPIIYRSIRLGKGGKQICCLKFRTMHEDADKKLKELLVSDLEKQKEWKMFQKLKQDPRITSIGRFLRRTSLDEVLQFWNVLKGDLSVVGPRPLTLCGTPDTYLDEVKSIYGENALLILSVRPGITGVWQISGRSNISLKRRQEMEANYILRRTFFADFLVILKTIPAVLFSKGAY